jgi:hypothetical protein
MSWKCYEKVIHGKTKACLDNMVLWLQYKETTTIKFLAYLRPKLPKFIIHNYVAQWQDEQYRVCLESFPHEFVLYVVDFVENYTFHDFDEIQEMHWHSFQLTILVHICYRWNEAYVSNPNFGAKKLIIKYQYYISDDTKHDTLFVQRCFELHWE